MFMLAALQPSITDLRRILLLNYWFWIMHCCIHTPTTDSNTSTGMISVILNMPSAAEECSEPSGNFALSGEWSLWIY